jgi:hypothetical protein
MSWGCCIDMNEEGLIIVCNAGKAPEIGHVYNITVRVPKALHDEVPNDVRAVVEIRWFKLDSSSRAMFHLLIERCGMPFTDDDDKDGEFTDDNK